MKFLGGGGKEETSERGFLRISLNKISFVYIIHIVRFIKIRIFKLSEFPCKITRDEVSVISWIIYSDIYPSLLI